MTQNNYEYLKKKTKSDDSDVIFIKQVPVHPRDRMKKKLAAINKKIAQQAVKKEISQQVNLKQKSKAITADKIVKKYRKLKRKATLNNYRYLIRKKPKVAMMMLLLLNRCQIIKGTE